jgi:dihydrofolate reductase
MTASRPEIVVVAALAARDRLIGDGLDLPWHLPADFRRFKAMTLGHPLAMGRRTFESLVHQTGGPLPGRDNVVLSRDPARSAHPDAHMVASLDEALAAYSDRERLFIGGGAAVYGTALGADGTPVLADRLELTLVEGDFSGDTYFPPYEHLLASNGGPFRLDAVERHDAEAGRPAFRFETYTRIG